jgi:ABC-type sugar transport system substrate-binding protein
MKRTTIAAAALALAAAGMAGPAPAQKEQLIPANVYRVGP